MEGIVVLYPPAYVGHLAPMIELGKILLARNFDVHIVTAHPNDNTGTAVAATSSLISSSSSSFFFHVLPPVGPLSPNSSPHQEASEIELRRLSNPHLRSFLASRSSPVRAIVLDFFCVVAMDVADELSIPSYVFFTSGATCLAALLHLPFLHSEVEASFKDLGDTLLHFPGVPPIPARDMPLPLLDREDQVYKDFLFTFTRMQDARGILSNTFASLELIPLQAVEDGRVIPGRKPPAFYCVGPLYKSKSQSSEDTCLNWLDLQPPRSVVFLCFGSLGAFSEPQLREIAIGLERSGQRFLWAVRNPPTLVPGLTPRGDHSAPPEPDLQALLPEGFADRTAERGMVVKSWVPQAEVLRHVAIGGFVTHGGWNSVLEAVGGGVPMVVWPLYAEQRLNKVVMVEMGLAVEMRGYEKGMVEAGEVEERVRGLLEAQWGKDLTARIKLAKLASEEAVAKQGSSVVAIDELVANIKLQEV